MRVGAGLTLTGDEHHIVHHLGGGGDGVGGKGLSAASMVFNKTRRHLHTVMFDAQRDVARRRSQVKHANCKQIFEVVLSWHLGHMMNCRGKSIISLVHYSTQYQPRPSLTESTSSNL